MSTSPQVHSAASWIAKGVACGSSPGGSPAVRVLPDVFVQYCGSWGYAPRYAEVKTHLEREFPGIACSFSEDEGTTGNFEVSVAGRLVHSKTNGDGFVDSPGKLKFLDRAVREATTVTDAEGGVGATAAAADIEFAKASVVDGGGGGGEAEGDEEEEQSNSSLIVSMLTLVLSIPALIGAWCWPALVIGLVSGTVSSFARTLGHWLSLGITALMMLAVNWFMIRALKTRYIPMSAGHGCMGRCCRKYGPCILTAVAAPLILADLCRHVAGDLNIWPWCGDPSVQRGLFPRVNESWTDACFWSSTEYVCNIPCCVPGNNTVASTNDLSMNYLLQYDNTSQRNYQRSFSQFCGLSADGEMMPIHGAPYTNPNCTCGGDACDQNKSPADQMALLDATDPALGALRVLAEGDKQDGNFPQGFGPDPTEPWDAAFGPWWPEYPQLDEVQLKRIKDQALLGGLDAESTPDCNCDNCVPPEQENIHHLSFIGVLFTIFFTYTGFVLLATGTLWNADILHKLAEMKKKWRLLRARRAKQRNKSGAVQQGSDDDRSTPLLGGSSKDGDQI